MLEAFYISGCIPDGASMHQLQNKKINMDTAVVNGKWSLFNIPRAGIGLSGFWYQILILSLHKRSPAGC
jgi:hypothetical protein